MSTNASASSSSEVPDKAPSPSEAPSDALSLQVPHLELRIHTNRVGLYPAPPKQITSDELAYSATTTTDPDPTSSGFICLLSGPLRDFHLYTEREHSQWLIDIANDICDPSLKRGSLKRQTEDGGAWEAVDPTHPLTASIYLYDVQTVVSLSKISDRTGKSRTSATGNGSTMANRVKQRDGRRCWVTNLSGPLVNSHVCPKRMGDHLFRCIYRDFVSNPPPPALSVYDEICGISLIRTLDTWFDVYELGLRFVGPDEYECHSFLPPDWPPNEERTILGEGENIPETIPRVQGHSAGPPRAHSSNPPPGLIRWHYLQCVLRKFADSDYKGLQNIGHYELPFRMEGDSDDEATDGEHDWPSAILDYGRAMQAGIEEHKESQRSVAEWVVAV